MSTLNNTLTTSEVSVLRMNMFCQRSQDVQGIPPTQDALILHLRRAMYQASIWYTSHQPMFPEEDPSSFGWQESNNYLMPRWTSHGTATEVFKLTVNTVLPPALATYVSGIIFLSFLMGHFNGHHTLRGSK